MPSTTTAAPARMSVERRVLEHGQVEQHVAGSLRMNRLSTFGQGIVDRRDGRCLVVLHPDQVGCVLGGATSSRQHQGQGLADIPDPVRGQQWHIGGDELGPVEHGTERIGVSEVCGGEHGEDPRGLAGFRGLDLGEGGGGDLGPDDCDVEQTRTGDVVDEAGITGEKVLVLEPGDRCARPCGHRRPGLQWWTAITLYPGPGAERPSIESWHPTGALRPHRRVAITRFPRPIPRHRAWVGHQGDEIRIATPVICVARHGL